MRNLSLVLFTLIGCNSLDDRNSKKGGGNQSSGSGTYGELGGGSSNGSNADSNDTATDTDTDSGDTAEDDMDMDTDVAEEADTDVTTICVTSSASTNGFAIAVQNLSDGDNTHWFVGIKAADGIVTMTIPSPLLVGAEDGTAASWCEEYPAASVGETIKLNGLGLTEYGWEDFLGYSCSGLDAEAVFYDGDVDDGTCSVVTFSVNGHAVTTVASDSYDFEVVVAAW